MLKVSTKTGEGQREVANRLRQEGIMIPIIGMSADSTKEGVEEFRRAGQYTNIEIIPKPFNFNQILRRGLAMHQEQANDLPSEPHK